MKLTEESTESVKNLKEAIKIDDSLLYRDAGIIDADHLLAGPEPVAAADPEPAGAVRELGSKDFF